MTDTHAQAVAPSAATPAGGFAIPTTSMEGVPLTARQQFAEMRRNDAWAREAVQPGTAAAGQLAALNQAMVAETATAQSGQGEAATPPEAFEIPYGQGAPETPDEQAADAFLRGVLSAVGFDKASGSSVASIVDRLATSREWSDETVAAHQAQSVATLRQVWGAAFDGNDELLDKLLDAAEQEHPGTVEFLQAHPWVLREPIVANTALGVARRRFGDAA